MKKILVPTDFSESAYNAGKYAQALAKVFNKELLFFYAGADKDHDNAAKLQNAANRVLMSDPLMKIYYTTSPKPFDPETVNEVVQAENIRLIVMGNTGEGGLAKKLFGSNTQVILENADCPVIAVPADYKFSGIKRVNYASDLSNLEEELSQVVNFARKFNSEVAVFHVSPVFPDLGNVEQMDVNSEIDALKRKLQYNRISYSTERMEQDNEVNHGIALFLERKQADLLVMFHNKQSYFDRLFSSSYSGSVASHLSIPFLVFPKI